MKQPTIHNYLAVLIGLMSSCLLFLQCPTACRPSNLPHVFPKNPAKDKTGRGLLRVRELSSKGAVRYAVVTIQPTTTGTALDQYAIEAHNVDGKGILFAAKGKLGQRIQYRIPLTTSTSLEKIYLCAGASEALKQGKSICFRCAYQPDASSAQGTKHHVQIKARFYDGAHHVVEEKESQVSFLITTSSASAKARSSAVVRTGVMAEGCKSKTYKRPLNRREAKGA